MQNTKHTPGPWVVSGELDSLRIEQANSEDPNSCDGIRQVCHVRQSDYEIPDYGEAEANARLIAAAPDLLATLQRISALTQPSPDALLSSFEGIRRLAQDAAAKAV